MFALDDDLCVLRVDEIIGKWMKMELIGKDELYEKTLSCKFFLSPYLSFIGSLDDLWVMKWKILT
jgi:hypothetical protein